MKSDITLDDLEPHKTWRGSLLHDRTAPRSLRRSMFKANQRAARSGQIPPLLVANDRAKDTNHQAKFK